MAFFNEYDKPDDIMDDPKYESEFHEELQRYWQELDNKKRWSE